MNVIHDIFNRFFKRVSNNSVQPLQTKIVILMPLLFHIYGLGRPTENKFDTVNREHTVRSSNTNIHHILICSYILILTMSTTLTHLLLYMQRLSKHPLLNDTIWKSSI
jgi:hypothetical protein